jgi:hypothetical protein
LKKLKKIEILKRIKGHEIEKYRIPEESPTKMKKLQARFD